MKFYKKIKSKSTVKSFLVGFAFLSFFGLLVRANNGILIETNSEIGSGYINDGFWNNLTNSGFLNNIETNKDGLITGDSYINNSGHLQEIFDQLYSGNNNPYTGNMSGYNDNGCEFSGMNFYYITGTTDNSVKVIPNTITDNSIYILDDGIFSSKQKLTLSGSCIAIIGKGDVEFRGVIDLKNARYNIIDNISYHNTNVRLEEYTINTGIDIRIENNSESDFIYYMTGKDINHTPTTLSGDDVDEFSLTISGNAETTLSTIFYDDYNFLNHILKTVIHDNTTPQITGTTLSGESVINNGIYNNGITISVYDTNLSGVFNNALFLSGGVEGEYAGKIESEGIYNILAIDKAGNQSELSFEIDTTAPSITNLIPASGSTQTKTSLELSRKVNEEISRIASQTYFLYSKIGELLRSGNISVGTTGVTINNIPSGIYTRKIEVTDTAGNVATGEANITYHQKFILYTGSNANFVGNIGYVNTNPKISFSGNQNFERKISTGAKHNAPFSSGNYESGTTIIDIPRGNLSTGNISVYLSYTGDNKSQTEIFNFYIDKTVAILSLTPESGRRYSTGNITHKRNVTNKPANLIKYYNFSINGQMLYSGKNTSYIQTGLEVNGEYKAQVCAYDFAGNVGCSPTKTTIIDQTPPEIHNIIHNGYYKNIPNPTPIITDESGIIHKITVKRNNDIVLATGNKASPYGIKLEGGEARYSIIAEDQAGNKTGVDFIIDTTPPKINLISPANGTIITGNNNIIFSRSGSDGYFSGYEFNLSGNAYGPIAEKEFLTGTSKALRLYNGNYERSVTIYDKAGNKTKSPTYYFTGAVPLTGDIKIANASKINNKLYIGTTGLQLETDINNATIATITGSIKGLNGLTMINKQIPAGKQITDIEILGGEGEKKIYLSLSDLVQTGVLQRNETVILDLTAPSIVNLETINNNSYSGEFTISWPQAIDNLAGIKGYEYIIKQDSNIIKSGTVSTNSLKIENMELGFQGTFEILIQSIDNVGNRSVWSAPAVFTYSGKPNISPDSFTFSRQVDVKRDTVYRSNNITITGLSSHTFVTASIDEGRLFINGNDVNKKGDVKNGDLVYIELQSSPRYFDVTSSTLTIYDKAAVFKLITERQDGISYDEDNIDDNLSSSEIIELEGLYLLVINLDKPLKLALKDMLEDRIDQLKAEGANAREIAKLNYIYRSLVRDINNSKDYLFTAPNGKKYNIIYKDGHGYTSSDFSKTNQTKYFKTTTEIEDFINKNNPGSKLNYTIDNTRKGADIIAPNGKRYTPFKSTDGKFGAYNMVVPKLFDTLKLLTDHIVKNNPKK